MEKTLVEAILLNWGHELSLLGLTWFFCLRRQNPVHIIIKIERLASASPSSGHVGNHNQDSDFRVNPNK